MNKAKPERSQRKKMSRLKEVKPETSQESFKDLFDRQADPVEIFEMRESRHEHIFESPAKNIIFAVLGDAVRGIIKKPNSIQARIDRVWIESGKNGTGLFSFDNVCHVLGINPDYFRDKLKKRADMGKGINPLPQANRVTPLRRIKEKRPSRASGARSF